MEQMRRYPVGIQTFERIIREGYIYIDKTDLVWQLAHYATFSYLLSILNQEVRIGYTKGLENRRKCQKSYRPDK